MRSQFFFFIKRISGDIKYRKHYVTGTGKKAVYCQIVCQPHCMLFGLFFSELKRHARVEHACRATCCKDHYCCSVDDTTRCLLRTMRVTLSIHPYMVHSVPFCPRGELCILFVQHNYRTGHRFHRSCTS
jgi:hypothetical protein